MSFQILRNAKVVASRTTPVVGHSAGQPCLHLAFEDGRTHTFPALSRESELLDIYGDDMNQISEVFNGGTYAFNDRTLVDYRNSTYRGFVHSDEGVAQLIERLGVQETASRKPARPQIATPASGSARAMFARVRGDKTNGVFMGREWDKFELQVPELGAGGEFENRLLYRWSPFSPNIQTSLEVERLVCNNGMVAMSPLVTHEVPVIDNWDEHLDVVTMQLKPRINAILSDRFRAMEETRASVEDVQRVHATLTARMDGSVGADDQSAVRLARLSQLTDVQRNLSRYYDTAVFSKRELAARADSHLSQFALYNVLTEAATHTNPNKTSDNSIQMGINRLVFDEIGRRAALENRHIPVAEKSDPERAFFSSVGEGFTA